VSRAPSLGFIPPQLPSLTDQPPQGAGWIHEVKHDGYRTMLLVERGFARAYTRNGHDWTDRYPGKYYLAHRDAILSRENANRKANPEARRVYEAAWRECNREKLRAYKQAWRERNRNGLRE
jgi:ATP-dependent DNA ligase